MAFFVFQQIFGANADDLMRKAGEGSILRRKGGSAGERRQKREDGM